MKKWLMAIVFGSVLVLGACGGGDDASDDGEAVEASAGEEAYKNSCASCHGQDLTGGAGDDLTEVGSRYSADEIADIIENGIGSMPAQKNVSDEDRTEIAEWLASKK